MANNHTGDRGYRACLDTESIMGDMGITAVGRWRRDSPPVTTFQYQGVNMGIVSWTDWMNCEVFDADRGVFRTEHITAVDWSQLKQDEGLHTLIGLPHWEFEFQHYPRRRTRELARELIDARGLDLIVGAHPHTLQPMEWFDSGLCAYSLGNFCGLGNAWSVKLISLLEIHLSMAPESKGKICSYRLHPFVQVHGDEEVSLVPLAKAPEPIKTRIERRLRLVFDVN
jgi:Bacterial capsule synthesis protein PGA_cap